jgi:hypothetical protein
VWQDRATRGKWSELSLSNIGWIVAVGIILFPLPSLAADDSELDSLQAYWRAQAPWCPFPSPGADAGKKKSDLKEFASKNEDGVGSNTPPCNDGDSIMFNGLLCLADVKVEPGEDHAAPNGERIVREVGCDVVKHSQTLAEGSTDYGRWWRSPRRAYLASLNQQPEGGSETTFSNDHALGVMAYIAQTRDVGAFQAWTEWIRTKGGECSSFHCIPGLPRYCPDDRCGFKLVDCPLLDRLATYLGQENPLCASDNVKKAYSAAWTVTDPLLVLLNMYTAKLGDIINKYGAGKQGEHSVERTTIVSSIINDSGYPLHDVAVTIYLLRKLGIANQSESQIAAEIAYARARDNAFFNFAANGSTAQVKSEILATCPSKTSDMPHPAFQWIWEREDIKETAKKTMYWDCIFIANASMKGDYPAPTVVPGIKEVAAEIAEVRNLVHASCAVCKNIECSGRQIDCSHKSLLEKGNCELDKELWKKGCEGKKFICTSTCS